MVTECTILFAASASGKTTWLSNLDTVEVPFISLGSHLDEVTTDSPRTTLNGGATDKAFVFDGDFLIWAASYWPVEPDWWTGPSQDHIGWHNMLTIMTMVHRMIVPDGTRVIVLFNGSIWPIKPIQEQYGACWDRDVNYSFKLVEVPEVEHRKYVTQRVKDDEARDGSFHGFPRHWRDAHNNRISLRNDFLIRLDVSESDVFYSFDEALLAMESA